MVSSSLMAGVPLTLGADDEEVFLIVITIVGAIFIVHLVLSNIRRMYQTRQREGTRREIAAYVAEGSIAPDDAGFMMMGNDDEFEDKIADGVAWGTISAEKAEKLIQSRRQAKQT